MNFSKILSIRWADIDANFHLRHSVYYDFGAQQRIEVLMQLGLTMTAMQEQHFGPVLFREECLFLREMKLTDTITVHVKLLKAKPDSSRWSIQHEFINQHGVRCALLTVDGAWMDTEKRKLANPTPQIVVDAIHQFPKTDDFVLL
jgi:acyl-CoA thioester hydrolase